jgi:hypothetical protein
MPTGAILESVPRSSSTLSNTGALSSGRLGLYAVYLTAGQTITSITFLSNATPLAVGTNQWFGIFTDVRAIARLTADDTSTAWAATALKTLALSSSYLVPSSGIYYVGIMVAAGTVPTLATVNTGVTTHGALTPIIGGTSSTGLTNPASCPDPAGAITASSNRPYFYLS